MEVTQTKPKRPKQAEPSPEQIAERCAAIRAEWSPAETLKRLRVDLRPAYLRIDGVREEFDADVYSQHHDRSPAQDEREPAKWD